MLTNHRRALAYALALLVSLAFLAVAVGRHPASAAPATTLPFIGRFDQHVNNAMGDIRVAPLDWLFRALNVIGRGVVTIPLRGLASLFLLVKRRWWRFGAFVATWAASELLLTLLKVWFHRGRPPGALVATAGASFPSGHATAAAATGIALVLAFFAPGRARRPWEWTAAVFALVMAFSRVYLHAHWFSDVVAGVLLGSGIALAAAAGSMEIATRALRRGAQPVVTDDG